MDHKRLAEFCRAYPAHCALRSIEIALEQQVEEVDITVRGDVRRRFACVAGLLQISGTVTSRVVPLMRDLVEPLDLGELEPDCPLCLHLWQVERTDCDDTLWVHHGKVLTPPKDLTVVKWTRIFGIDPHKEVRSIRDRMSPPGCRATGAQLLDEKKPPAPPPQQTWRDRPPLL